MRKRERMSMHETQEGKFVFKLDTKYIPYKYHCFQVKKFMNHFVIIDCISIYVYSQNNL